MRVTTEQSDARAERESERSTGVGSRRGGRARRFAKLYGSLDDSFDQQLGPAKEHLLQDLPARIVEIGPGPGSNLARYPEGAHVVALEPNVHFHEALRAAASGRGLSLTLHASDLRSARLPDASEDIVVSTLVLCSVGDVDAELEEIERVLRPGGRLLFIEHVAARSGSPVALYQRLVRSPWRAVADGCDTCAQTHVALERSELELVEAHLERLGSRLDPTSPTYWGVAMKVGSA